VQKFATARWLVKGCQSTPTVHIRKGNPFCFGKAKVRDNRMNQCVLTLATPRSAANKHGEPPHRPFR
jgi:hypothetical protein